MLRLLRSLAVVAVAGAVVLTSPRLEGAADAVVVHHVGFTATVAGWTSWYGSYRLDSVGVVWCVDHGISAPDDAHGYVPAPLDDHAPDTRRAMAWALAVHGPAGSTDPVAAAALMLVLHDLMGAIYPSGVLDVDRLGPTDMAGFGGRAQDVVDSARTWKAEAIARSGLRPPLTLSASVDGDTGLLVSTVTDAVGAPVPGIAVELTGDDRASGLTAADGRWTAAVDRPPPGGPDRSFHVAAVAPDLDLHSYRPTGARDQRVAALAVVPLDATAGWRAEAIPTPLPSPPPAHHLLTIDKRGDDTAYVPIAGARFEVGDQIVGPGSTVDLVAGRYTVTEVQAPDGYERAGPWDVDLTAADATLVVDDRVQRGALVVTKRDGDTHAALAGAVVAIDADRDHDGTFETPVRELTTTDGPTVVDGLVPADYRITERAPPAGYLEGDGPLTVVRVPPGGRAEVTIDDHAIPTAPPSTAAVATETTTTAAPPVTTTTAAPPVTTTTAAPPVTTTTEAASAPPVEGTLPTTGADSRGLAVVAAGLTGAGGLALAAERLSRRRRSRLPPTGRCAGWPTRGGSRG